jgi:prepilin peptidase CpaA
VLFDHLPSVALTWLLALTAAAALTDTRRGLIPNWLTLPTLALAPCAQLLCGGAFGGAQALGGVLACGLVPLAMFGLRAIGGGDVKLFAALGALCGASLGLELQLASYAIAAVVGLAAAARQGVLTALLERALRLLFPRRPNVRAPEATATALTSVRLGAPIFAAAVLRCAVDLAGAR